MTRPIKIKKNNGSPTRDPNQTTEEFINEIDQWMIDFDAKMGTSWAELEAQRDEALVTGTEELKDYLDRLEKDHTNS